MGLLRVRNGGKLHLVTSLVVVYLTITDSNVLGQDPFTFEDIYNTTVRGFSARWITGTDDFLYRNASGHLNRFHAGNQTEELFINGSYFDTLSSTYYLSHDYHYALFAVNVVPVWRHSFHASYHILNISTGHVTPFPNGPMNGSVLQYAGWGPDNSLTFVWGNNLYYQPDLWSPPVAITTNGDLTWIYNGIPDWLYEEDVFGDRIAHYYSPSGRHILYAEFNDTGIPLQPWPWYGTKSNVYTETRSVPYPKAGDVRDGKAGPNPVVKLFVVDTADVTTKIPLPTYSQLQNQDHYFTQAVWRNNHTVMVTWTNRVQNESWVVLYNLTNPDPQPDLNHPLHEENGWLQVPPADARFTQTGEMFLTILPTQVSVNSGKWRHLAMVKSPVVDANNDIKFLTEGEEEITSIVGYDEPRGTVYYISTGGNPAERHLYSVLSNGTHRICHTCHHPESCRYVTASFSSTFNYFILGCRGPEIPTYTLKSTFNVTADYPLENNDALREKLSQKAMPERKFINVTLEGNRTMRAEVFFPPDYVEGHKYPLLVYTYAGPDSQRVMKTFPLGGSTTNWLNYMKSTHGVIVASVDGRGTAAAGDKYKFEIYRHLGHVEIEDQIAAGRFFLEQDYVDKTLPLAIFGWSYGGFTAAHAIGTAGTSFGCGISIAPTTSKAYYNTAYTERYMGLATPDDNAHGYNVTDVMNKVDNFHNKTFLVAHGTADDNVHWMHTGQLISSLSAAGVLFRQNVYLDQDHGIGDRLQNRHLFLTLTDFLLNSCWPNRNSVVTTTTAAGATTPSVSGATTLVTSFGSMLLTSLVTVFVLQHRSASL